MGKIVELKEMIEKLQTLAETDTTQDAAPAIDGTHIHCTACNITFNLHTAAARDWRTA